MRLFICVIITLFYAVLGDNDARPIFCRHLECPKFSLIKKYDGLEERCYTETKWASTVVPAKNLSSISMVFYRRLYGYRRGENLQGITIKHTVPVLVKMKHCQVFSCVNTYKYLVVLPMAYQAYPPVPTNPNVVIETVPAFCAYVRSFPGFAPEATIRNQANLLRQDLLKSGKIDYEFGNFYFAGYDGPFTKTGRHNEVWFVKV